MRHFDYVRAPSIDDAVRERGKTDAAFVAGGTNLVDLMKDDIVTPARIVDINGLPLSGICDLDDGGLRLGALTTNAETAYDPRVAARYPVLSSAILAGASAQLRNAATNGGNLNQRTRCAYFTDIDAACNKRAPGSGCDAIAGYNRVNGILGTSALCIATHPSDMCVALAVLGARVRVTGPSGDRVIPFHDYHRLPGDEPWRDNVLAREELITAIDLPRQGYADNYTYLKLRDRQSYAFALVSVAVGLKVEDGRIREGSVALGGVAHKPWRLDEADALLRNATPSPELFGRLADALLAGAVGRGTNDFKIDLARRAIGRACGQAAAGTSQATDDKRIV